MGKSRRAPVELASPPSRTTRRTASLPPAIVPLNDAQAAALQELRSFEQTFLLGPAGTGKTYLIACEAIDALKEGRVDKIVLTRPNEPAGRSLGYFPGTLEEKMAPWVAEFTSIWKERAGAGFLETALKNGTVEIVPFETMRGRSFLRTYVICDEAQNATGPQLAMLVTRHGEGSFLAVNGDPKQTDLPERDQGALRGLLMVAQRNRIPVGFYEFTGEDIVRSGIVKQWVLAFERAM